MFNCSPYLNIHYAYCLGAFLGYHNRHNRGRHCLPIMGLWGEAWYVYLLGVLIYGARLLGMGFLVILGKESLTFNLALACLLGTVGVMISTADIKLWSPRHLFMLMKFGRRKAALASMSQP